jgi:hypothetical protein
VTSTLFTLFVLPSVYAQFARPPAVRAESEPVRATC